MLRIQRIPDFTPKLLLVRKRLLGLEPEGITYVLPRASVLSSSKLTFGMHLSPFCPFFPQYRPHDSSRGGDRAGGVLQRAGSHRLRQIPRSCILLAVIFLLFIHLPRPGRQVKIKLGLRSVLYRWHRVGKTLPLTAHPCKTVKAHTDGFHRSPCSGLLGFTIERLWSCF